MCPERTPSSPTVYDTTPPTTTTLGSNLRTVPVARKQLLEPKSNYTSDMETLKTVSANVVSSRFHWYSVIPFGVFHACSGSHHVVTKEHLILPSIFVGCGAIEQIVVTAE